MSKVKEFWEEHWDACTHVIVIGIAISLLLFIFLPVSGTITVDQLIWHKDISVEQYKTFSEKSWESPPKNAYDIETKKEVYATHTKTVVDKPAYTDTNGVYHSAKTHQETTKEYRTRYYYKIDRWGFSHYIPCSGFDRHPHEAECDLPFDIPQPKLGDFRRGGTKDYYEVHGFFEQEGKYYDISEEDWKRIEIGGAITFKKFRFSERIWNIKFV